MGRQQFAVVAAILTGLLFFQNCSDMNFLAGPPISLASAPILCYDASAPEVKPKLLWDWRTQLAQSPAPRYEPFDQVMSSPMAGDLDRDGFPEVVFTTFSIVANEWYPDSANSAHHRKNGVLRVVDGRTGITKFSVSGTLTAPMGDVSPLLMDIDGDGFTEIFYPHYGSQKIIALNYNGSLRWSFTLPVAQSFAPTGLSGARNPASSIGDVFVGPYLVSESAARVPYVRTTLAIASNAHVSPLALPLNPALPGNISLVNHYGIYNPANGAVIGAAFPVSIGFSAAGDIDKSSPGLEIVGVGGSTLRILNGQTGAVLRSVDLTAYNDLICPNAGVGGGPPSIGDFDGDGATLEIAIATGRHLTIFDNQGLPKYKTISQDCSSLSTGLTSFDLNGDKKPEIIYADEEYLRIYEVRNGVLTVVQQIVNPSGTLHEYPIVADITGTGRAALVVSSNNYAAPYFYADPGELNDRTEAVNITGVRAFTSTGANAWMPTKPVWNQHSFHPDLINNASNFLAAPFLDGTFFRRNNQGVHQQTVCISK